jgi:release factor glutamine methyltransferase
VTSAETWTIARLLEWTTKFLGDKGSESPRLDAQVLLAHALGCRRIDLYTRFDEVAADEPRKAFRELVRRRIEGCPVAYLVGHKEFYSLEFEVGPDVLIPRPDSECVVDECLRLIKDLGLTEPRVLDLGTGSGNLAVSVARYCKTAQVDAVDLSSEALAVAGRNAARHDVAGRVRFLPGDLYEPIPAEEIFDFILSNPPYIPRGDVPGLPCGVRDYEPHLALDGGLDGFAVFDRLLADSTAHLKPGGYLIVEIGSPQEQPARARIEAHGGYDLEKTVFDSSGHPRVLKARRRG